MFEFMAIAALVVGGFLVLAAVAAIGFVLKVAFKLLLLPFWLLGALLKGLLFVGAFILLIVFVPLAALIALIALPFALIAGLIGLGASLVA